jgi:hypothetical protein
MILKKKAVQLIKVQIHWKFIKIYEYLNLYIVNKRKFIMNLILICNNLSQYDISLSISVNSKYLVSRY